MIQCRFDDPPMPGYGFSECRCYQQNQILLFPGRLNR